MSSLRSAATLAFAALVAAGGLAEARAQVAGHASPPEVSAAAPAATDDQAFIIDFLEKGYLQAWFAHPSSVRQHFADPIENYWGRRNVGLNEIVREKLGYARKWTFRFYRLKPETVRLVPAAGRASTFNVTFEYEFVADRVPERSAGTGETTLLLEVIGDQVKIHAENGRVLTRKRAAT